MSFISSSSHRETEGHEDYSNSARSLILKFLNCSFSELRRSWKLRFWHESGEDRYFESDVDFPKYCVYLFEFWSLNFKVIVLEGLRELSIQISLASKPQSKSVVFRISYAVMFLLILINTKLQNQQLIQSCSPVQSHKSCITNHFLVFKNPWWTKRINAKRPKCRSSRKIFRNPHPISKLRLRTVTQ